VSAFDDGVRALQRRTDVLGGERTEDGTEVVVRTDDPEAVLRHILSGYVPGSDMEKAMTWSVEMAKTIVTNSTAIDDPDSLIAAVTMAVAQTLGIGAATERSASGRSV
jgi:hypothetical protein